MDKNRALDILTGLQQEYAWNAEALTVAINALNDKIDTTNNDDQKAISDLNNDIDSLQNQLTNAGMVPIVPRKLVDTRSLELNEITP